MKPTNNTYYAAIDTESLFDPTIVNKFEQLKVLIEYEPSSTASKYHHVFLVKIFDDKIQESIKIIQNSIKEGWFAFFWDKDKNITVYKGASFEMFPEAIEYGKTK